VAPEIPYSATIPPNSSSRPVGAFSN